jgi:hypothetical protein
MTSKPNKKDLLNEIKEMIQSIEKLPPHAMIAPITHYDYWSMLLLLSAILKSDLD